MKRARWGIFITTIGMGVALVVTGLTNWSQHREATRVVAEARAHDVFRAVHRSLREEGPQAVLGDEVDLAGLLADFEDAGLRYVALVTPRGELIREAGRAAARLVEGPAWSPPGEPVLTNVAGRIRLDGMLGPRRMGRGVRLVLEVEPVLADAFEASALEHLVVSSGAAGLLIALAIIFSRMAARADRAEVALARQRQLAVLGEMSAVLGHELRNPLAALKGHAQLVVERTDPEARAFKNAERVVIEAERLEQLTAQILDFARTGAVQPALNDPGAMLRTVAEKIPGDEVRLDIAGAPASWRLDRPRMEQVLENLVKNAVQASEQASDRAIDVTCRVAGDALVIAVRDRGPGFVPGEEQAVFEPFRTHRVQGTGLGLAIARRIVEAHGGRIVARNATDGGAVVEVRLPREPRTGGG